MDDLTRFALAWAGLLVLAAAMRWAADRLRGQPVSEREIKVEARLRWWVLPLLYSVSIASALRLPIDEDRWLGLIPSHGWKIVTRLV